MLLVAGISMAGSSQASETKRASTDSAAIPDSAGLGWLDAFAGRWRMTGVVRDKPVRYEARGEWVLQRGFLRLHMQDAAKPPAYEADLFLGYDAQAGDYVGHWLDRFGGAGARVVATGRREDDRLVIVFPYAEGAFRNTFTRTPGSRRWTLLIEAQKPDGSWETFASYDATPA